jgi:hypothetical protein
MQEERKENENRTKIQEEKGKKKFKDTEKCKGNVDIFDQKSRIRESYIWTHF